MTTVATIPPSTPATDDGSPTTTTKNKPLWQLALGAAVIIALLWMLGGWPLPVVIIGIILMILMHELGHFVTAKWTGMKASEFFVGFGPRLWSTKIGETEYGIKAGVLGGYVKIHGMTNLESVPADEEARTFRAATFPRRVLVASAGSIMHVLMALVLAWASFAFFGRVVAQDGQVTQLDRIVGVAVSPAQAAGLRAGDVIVKIDGRRVHENALIKTIRHSVGQQLRLTVLRNGHTVHLVATPLNGHNVFTMTGGQRTRVVPLSERFAGVLGVELQTQPVTQSVSPLSAIPSAFSLVYQAVSLSLTHLPGGVTQVAHQVVNSKAASNPKNQDERLVSIFGIARAAVDAAESDPRSLLVIFMAINIGVGIVNMLPMLPLDGGYVAVAIYERVRTRRGQPAYRADVSKLNPVVFAFVAVLLVIFAATLYLDITHPVSF